MVFDPQNRDEKGRFKRGNIANPGGRPAVARDFQAWCRDFTEKTGKEKLKLAASDTQHPFFGQAQKLILAYGYGLPSQELHHAGTVNLNVKYDNPQPNSPPSDPAR